MSGTPEGARKAVKVRRERYGADIDSKNGRLGGLSRTRGYFGKLKQEGNADELRKLSKKGNKVMRFRTRKWAADKTDLEKALGE